MGACNPTSLVWSFIMLQVRVWSLVLDRRRVYGTLRSHPYFRSLKLTPLHPLYMKKLEMSIKDNWYSDLYPTWIDAQIHYWGFYEIKRILRTIEIFIFRREQLDYWK